MATRAQPSLRGLARRIATGVALMAVGVALVLASAGPASADNHRLTICHATGADANNPYVVITPAKAAVVNGHYGEGRGDHQNGDDIIPAFRHRGVDYAAQGDQAILANNCRPVTTTTSATTTTSTTTTSTTTTTRTQSGSTTSSAPTTEAAKTTTQHQAAVTTTAPRRTTAPIPGAVDAGTNEASSWQLPVGGALIVLGALGVATTVARRSSAKR